MITVCLFLAADDIFMKLTPIVFFRFPQNNLDSTQRSRKIDKIVANTLRSFFPPQIIAAATIDFLFSVPESPLHKLSNAHWLGCELPPLVGVEAPLRRRGSGYAGPFNYRLNS